MVMGGTGLIFRVTYLLAQLMGESRVVDTGGNLRGQAALSKVPV